GLVALILAITSFFVVSHLTKPVSADEYDARINALQEDMSRYQKEADKLNQQASTLANALAQLSNQRSALQAQIDLSQAQYDKLVIQIADTEKKIKDNQDALGATLADLYVDDSISPIEMLASSKNISDYLDKQEYRNAIRDDLGATIQEVKTLRIELTTKKKEVETVLAEQKLARNDLQAKESEQASLLAQTKSDESEYQSMIAENKEEIAKAKALQAALRARANSSGGYTIVNSGTLGEYTSLWAPNSCSMGGPGGWYSYGGADGNGGDGKGYGCRQCASYVAWRVAKETGYYYTWGNGGSFASRAISAGYTNLGNNPQPGSIAVMWGDPGHVAWVEAVDGD
ncbi:CHAP domain-containing protein, partial [Candidatus Saccharibacteria bacterium]|nr:CHAP domain-containing protein [Candidatus Saccharibacteria bacterium]